MTTNNDNPSTYNDGREWHYGGKPGTTGSLDANGNNTGKGLRVEMGGGVEVRVGRHGSATVADDSTSRSGGEARPERIPNGASGLLATARTSWGSIAQPGNLKPSDRVTYQGMEIEVATAEKLGLLARNSQTGLYQETGAPGPTDAPPAEPRIDGSEDAQREEFHAGGENFLAMLPQQALTGMMNDFAATGEISPQSIDHLARELGSGFDPSHAQKYAGAVMQLFADQASARLANYGIDDGQAFVQWCLANKAGAFKEAVQEHFIRRSTRAYDGLAKDYLGWLHDNDPEAILTADFGEGVRAQRMGREIVLNIPGHGQVSFKGAIRSGLVGRRSR